MSFRLFGQVAQLVEQRTENPRVGGSIPSLATKSPASLADTRGMDHSEAKRSLAAAARQA